MLRQPANYFALFVTAACAWLVACGGGGSSEAPTATPVAAIATATPGVSAATATPAATGPAGNTYVVQAGDTLSEIATSFNVTVEALAAANGIDNPDQIFPGQELTIPGN